MRKFRGLVIVVTLCCGIWVLIARCNSSTSTKIAAEAPITATNPLTATETAVVWGLIAGTILLFSLLIRWVWRSITKKNGDTDPPPSNYAGWKKFGKSLGTVAICILIGWVIYLGYGWWEESVMSQTNGSSKQIIPKTARDPRSGNLEEFTIPLGCWFQIHAPRRCWAIRKSDGKPFSIGPDNEADWWGDEIGYSIPERTFTLVSEGDDVEVGITLERKMMR